jgi:Icc-related predicted phosphoesterase
MRIFFATDIHGSEVCWRKFLNARPVYEPDAMVIGGDITGKVLVPIVAASGDSWTARTNYGDVALEGEEALRAYEREIADVGSYTVRLSADEYEAIRDDPERVDAAFHDAVLARVEAWMELAAERLSDTDIPLLVSGGNDDYWEVDEVLGAASRVRCPDRDVIELGPFDLLSFGAANETPWSCPRDMSEDELAKVYGELIAGLDGNRPAIFNLHVPPYGTALDEAPLLDENQRPTASMTGTELAPVGSTAVRAAIEETQPTLSLHGHVHESRAMVKIGKSTALNPGSEYSQGVLRAAIVDVDEHKVRRHQFITG